MAGLKLEVFETEEPSAQSMAVSDNSALEEDRLVAYEKGYNAGWEDANAAAGEDQSRMRGDLARALQTLGFTFHEARAHILKALGPLMQEMVGKLLPDMARETLGPTILEILMPLAEEMADAPMTLVVNPTSRPAVEALLEHATGLPLVLVEEPTLSDGQAYLRLSDAEIRINLDRAAAEISDAVRGFFGISEKEIQNG